MKANQASHSVRVMCRLLKVSKSGFYAWNDRAMAARERADIRLSAQIHAIHRRSRETYGAPRIHEELRMEHGCCVGRKRVARLMRAAGLKGVRRNRYVVTTTRDREAAVAPDLVDRNFVVTRADQLWAADITYIPTWTGFLYLAIVLDAFSRKVIGWAMENHLRTELVLAALNMALAMRRPEDVIHHSDRGTQYTSIAFGLRCIEMGVRPSMGSTGDAYDNAMAESFFATLEIELLQRHAFKSQAEARVALFEYIEGWYNPHRRHSALGYRSPITFERAAEQLLLPPAADPSTALHLEKEKSKPERALIL